MDNSNPIADLLARMAHYTCWGSPWHSLAEAAEELTDDRLSYRLAPGVSTPREVIRHTAACARWYAGAVADRTACPAEEDADRLARRPARTAKASVDALDADCRRLQACAESMNDDQLLDRTGIGRNAYKGFVLIEGAILHPAWHFGQLAMLGGWSRRSESQTLGHPTGPPGRPLGARSLRDWDVLDLRSRGDACLRVLQAAYNESPWHSLRRQVAPMSEHELAWAPFADAWGPMIAIHVAACKAVYADHAFGTATLGWDDCDRVLGASGDHPDGARIAAILDRAQQFLVDHVARADDEALERTYPMHHGHPLTGWQVVATMAQHDAWHAGQIALMRKAHRASA